MSGTLPRPLERKRKQRAHREEAALRAALPGRDARMFGLERQDAITAELRRIRVDSQALGFWYGREMLAFAEDAARQDGCARMAFERLRA